MLKATADQIVGAQLLEPTAFSTFNAFSVFVYVTLDGGTQTLGETNSGVATYRGNGYHDYSPTAAEVAGDHVAFTFISSGGGAIPVTEQRDLEPIDTLTDTDKQAARLL